MVRNIPSYNTVNACMRALLVTKTRGIVFFFFFFALGTRSDGFQWERSVVMIPEKKRGGGGNGISRFIFQPRRIKGGTNDDFIFHGLNRYCCFPFMRNSFLFKQKLVARLIVPDERVLLRPRILAAPRFFISV